jgi:hypothetical protein
VRVCAQLFVMCNHNYFDERWADSRDSRRANATSVGINATGEAPQDYTTSQIGWVAQWVALYCMLCLTLVAL